MRIVVTCKICGRILSQVVKPQVSDEDLDMYEHNTECDIDGPNSYSYDEDGLLISEEVHVIATKMRD